MRHHIFGHNTTHQYPIALLIKESSFDKQQLERVYIRPLHERGVSPDTLVAFTLGYSGKTVTASAIKKDLEQLLPALTHLGVHTLLVADSAYFKTLTGQRKAEPHHGYQLPCKIKGFEQLKIILGVNYSALVYNPTLQDKLSMSLKTLADSTQGKYVAIGTGIIHGAHYPKEVAPIKEALKALHQHPILSCDIEGFSLTFHKAGIATIAFAWDEHNGVAFPCKYWAYNERAAKKDHQISWETSRADVYSALREFFETYQGTLIFHNSSYDVKVIIYDLWMSSLTDVPGLLKGLDIMTRDLEDTKIIAYLATNTTTGNHLGLKHLAHEFAGNWAEGVGFLNSQIIPEATLLEYNLIDALSTMYVYNKLTPIMVQDQQEHLYRTLMLPTNKVLLQTELIGMPLSNKQVIRVKQTLQMIQTLNYDTLVNHPVITTLNLVLQDSAMQAANAKLKTKVHPLDHFASTRFNPNSSAQLIRLLYEQMGLPILERTPTKQPCTGVDTLQMLLNHTTIQGYKDILESLISYNKVTKILSTFIPPFEQAIEKEALADTRWLHGSFNLGGTVSGRLSSSDPNLMNLPATSTYGKLIKSCFIAPKGWIFAGADFNALEDRVNTLLTQDPNKIKILVEGYDPHCYRAFYYFPDQLPGIVETVESINSIKDLFPEIRQLSKSPTFALQYQGTWRTLVKNLGFAEPLAKQIEKNYNTLYKVSNDWVAKEVDKASQCGYATTAFGLRIRTPILAQTILNQHNTPFIAEAEARTLGNAVSGQSYGQLTNRAWCAFMQKVWTSPYRHDILPVAQIHDAGYLLIRDHVDIVQWCNEELIKQMAWCDLPELQNPQVKITAELDLYYNGWDKPITIPNNATQAQIIDIVKNKKAQYDKAI
jgi:DNA polymerase-1